jgi:hypothetical protein
MAIGATHDLTTLADRGAATSADDRSIGIVLLVGLIAVRTQEGRFHHLLFLVRMLMSSPYLHMIGVMPLFLE